MARKPDGPLRRGWTTGACATAATKAAYTALLTGAFPDPVSITLPKGEQPSFALSRESLSDGTATAAIVKDAGDDPDVTHLATISVTVRPGAKGSGVTFRAGDVDAAMDGMDPGRAGERHDHARRAEDREPADNAEAGVPGLACQRLPAGNGDLDFDVARAEGFPLIAACTGSTSEAAVAKRHGLPETAFIDMGDFAGGMLKYLRRHPVPKLIIGGGFAKLAKLAEGHMDLHSGRSQIDMDWLAAQLGEVGGTAKQVLAAREANTGLEVLNIAKAANLLLGDRIATLAREEALQVLDGAGTEVIVEVFDREGTLVGSAGEV
jgi:cobalt-precorrin-5B (C1)-methyltransferase